MSSSSSSSILIAITMDSALSVSTTKTKIQTKLFKPPNGHLAGDRRRGRALVQLHRRRNNCASVSPLRCSASASDGCNDVIVLRVGGMMCEGCASSVKKILESRPQVSSASVNLASETAIISPVSEEKTAPNWQKQLGKALAEHLTGCGFSSSLQGQEDSG